MSKLFLTILNMSISAGWIVLAVLLLRLALRKAPRWLTSLLWGIVGIRLICPFSIKSVLSLLPSAQTISPEIMLDPSPEIQSGIPVLNNAINPIISNSLSPAPGASVNPLQVWVPILTAVWVAGVVALLLYTAISYWRLCQKVSTAVLLRDRIYQCETVASPFVLGVIRPRIYLPFAISEQDATHVIAHEMAHIQRRDHLWKPLGFLLLALHWFNPLLWLGYVLLCRDIELACDEKVVKELSEQERADYSQALLSCSVNRRMIAACPLAFGEVGVKERIKSVLNYKKPAFWIIVVAVLALLVTSVCLLTDPRPESEDTPQDWWTTRERLKEEYPMYFNFEHSITGLEVYIWQTAEDTYCCGLLPRADSTTQEEVWALQNHPTTIEEMRIIVGSHSSRYSKSWVTIIPIVMPDSGYDYELTDEYCTKVTNLFWTDFVAHGEWTLTHDRVEYDIDNDGIEEICALQHGTTSGVFTFAIAIRENNRLEYRSGFYSPEWYDLSFTFREFDGKLLVQGVTQEIEWLGRPSETHLYEISFEEGKIILTRQGDPNDRLVGG